MQGIFRRKSSESNVSSQAVHFNPQTSEVALPESNVKPKLSRRTRLVLFIRDSKWGGVPLAVLYGLYMYYMVTFLILSDPAPMNSVNVTNRYETDGFSILVFLLIFLCNYYFILNYFVSLVP